MSLKEYIGKSQITGKQLDKIDGTISSNKDGTITYHTTDGIFVLQPLKSMICSERYKVLYQLPNKK